MKARVHLLFLFLGLLQQCHSTILPAGIATFLEGAPQTVVHNPVADLFEAGIALPLVSYTTTYPCLMCF